MQNIYFKLWMVLEPIQNQGLGILPMIDRIVYREHYFYLQMQWVNQIDEQEITGNYFNHKLSACSTRCCKYAFFVLIVPEMKENNIKAQAQWIHNNFTLH